MASITSVSASSNSQMVVCCRCNAERRCKNCSSKKAGMKCVFFDCLPLRKGHCENEPVEVPSCYEKKVNVSIINSQAEVNSRFTRSALTELSSLEVDLEMPSSFPTGPSNDLLSESFIYIHISRIILSYPFLNILVT